MSWFGKIIGGTMGLVFGGPIGAVCGTALGHYLLDESLGAIAGKSMGSGLDNAEQQQAIFFITTFSLLAKLAKVDGVISREEIKLVDQVIKIELKLDDKTRNFAIQVFNVAKTSEYSFEDYANQFYQTFYKHRQILSSMVDVLLRVAAADGIYHPKEEELIRQAVRIFKLSDAEYEALKERHIRDSEKYYSILGVSPKDSDTLIKTRYRKLVHEYHPDKIIAKGLPPEFEAFANLKFQQIQKAY